MKYDPNEKLLMTDDGYFLKKLDCPINKQWGELEVMPGSEIKRYCSECERYVLNIERFTDEQVLAIIRYDPEVCVYFTEVADNIKIKALESGLRVVSTARDIDGINAGAEAGFWPLLKTVRFEGKVHSKLQVCQDPSTGFVSASGDYRRWSYSKENCFEFNLIPQFKNPFAAYLIPKDIETGERVLLEDLIDEYIGGRWNQGDTYRLRTAEATWNGEDFDIHYDEEKDIFEIVG